MKFCRPGSAGGLDDLELAMNELSADFAAPSFLHFKTVARFF
jgi:hypothetical protein